MDEYFALSWWEFGMMADRRKALMEHDWSLQSALMALMANINRDSKSKPTPFSPDDFNPFKHQAQEAEKPKDEDLQERLERLKKLFPDGTKHTS